MRTHAPLLGSLLLATLGSAALAAPQSPPAGSQAAPPANAAQPANSAQPANAAPAPQPLSDEEASYLLGLSLGSQIHTIGGADAAHLEAIDRGVKDGLKGKRFAPQDQRRLQEYGRATMMAQSQRNEQVAKDFLAKNAHEKGVKATASGLQYKVLKAGDTKGATPKPTDQVTVNYRGTLIDGTEFDSSYSRGQPANFSLSGVIKGWQEGLALMKPGAKYELFVPPELAYGPQPRPGIPGNSLLIFEVELLSVKAPAASEPAPTSPAKPAVVSTPSSKMPASAPGASSPDEPAARSTTQP